MTDSFCSVCLILNVSMRHDCDKRKSLYSIRSGSYERYFATLRKGRCSLSASATRNGHTDPFPRLGI